MRLTHVCMRCRAARFANSAARGGQVMLPLTVAQKLVEQWTGKSLPLDTAEPVMLQPPDFEPLAISDPLPHTYLQPKPSSPAPSSRFGHHVSSKVRISSPSKFARRLTSKNERTKRFTSELEPAPSEEIMLSPDQRESHSCPEFPKVRVMEYNVLNNPLSADEDSDVGVESRSPSLRSSPLAPDSMSAHQRKFEAGNSWLGGSTPSRGDSMELARMCPIVESSPRAVQQHWSVSTMPDGDPASRRQTRRTSGASIASAPNKAARSRDTQTVRTAAPSCKQYRC